MDLTCCGVSFQTKTSQQLRQVHPHARMHARTHPRTHAQSTAKQLQVAYLASNLLLLLFPSRPLLPNLLFLGLHILSVVALVGGRHALLCLHQLVTQLIQELSVMGDHNHGHVLALQIPCTRKQTISNGSNNGHNDSNTDDDNSNSDENTNDDCISGDDSEVAGAMQVSSLQAGVF